MKKFFLSVVALFLAFYSNAEIKQMVTVCEKQQEFHDIEQINLDSRFCKLSIKQAEGVTTFNGKLEAMVQQDGYDFAINNEGSSCTIKTIIPEDGNTSFAGEIEIALNPKTHLTIETTSGFVNMNDLIDCNITIRSTQGKLTISNCTGTIDAETKNGAIKISKFDGNLIASTSRGDIDAIDAKGIINLESSDGNLIVSNLSGTAKCATVAGQQTYQAIEGDLSVKGSSGNLKFSDMNGNLTIKTMTSPVNLFNIKGKLVIETTKGAIIGSKGITLTESSSFTTTEGKIQLTFTNGKDDLSFDLQSENSKAAIIARGNSKKKKLSFGKGSIVVTGRTRTGGQVYK